MTAKSFVVLMWTSYCASLPGICPQALFVVVRRACRPKDSDNFHSVDQCGCSCCVSASLLKACASPVSSWAESEQAGVWKSSEYGVAFAAATQTSERS